MRAVAAQHLRGGTDAGRVDRAAQAIGAKAKFAPAATIASAEARPSPDAPPVMMNVFPEICITPLFWPGLRPGKLA